VEVGNQFGLHAHRAAIFPCLKGIARATTAAFLCLLLLCPITQSWQGDKSGQIKSGEIKSGEIIVQIIVVDSATEAERILQQLKTGADFATLAKQKSIDPSAATGGFMGQMNPATLRPELRDALKNVQPGQVSGVTRFSEGYAILKVLPPSAAANVPNSRPNISTSARGSVRYALNIGGLNDADAVFNALPKPSGWQQDLPAICEARKQSLAVATGELAKRLSAADAELHPYDVLGEHHSLAQLEAYQGDMGRAIEQWQAAYQLATDAVPSAVSKFLEALGIAYLHKSEMENDGYRNPGDRCIFPPRASTKYADPADSRKAIEYFLKYLEQKPDDQEVKWLLNMAHLTLGTYPSGVPQKYLIPASAFASKEEVGRFVDVAPMLGMNTFSMAGGIVVDDFENNGRLDVVTSSVGVCEPMHYFHNNGDGTFTDQSVKSGLSNQLGGLNLIQADYNNDGCMDVLVLRGGWEFPQRMSLLQGHCDGTFTDVTRESGLAATANATQAGAWADIDNDGFVDLFVGSESGPAQLFRNKGDGTFEDITHSAGVDRTAFTKAVVSGDYNNDGYADFYLSNYNGNNFLYHNNHDRTFTEVGAAAGVQDPWASFPAWFFDYDNDGWPDLFVSSYAGSSDEVMRSYLQLPTNAESLKLYKNMHDGTFKDVAKEVGLDRVFMPMGSNFGDIDNDGFLDIYLGSGASPYSAVVPSVLLRNKAGKSFVDVTASAGTGELHKGHGVAFADMDRDGDEDILTVIGGATPGDSHAFRFFENPGNGNDWIDLKLVGVKTNRAALGARITITVENESQGSRSIYRTVSSGGSFGASPLEQHIGLGKAARITNVEIWWPTSNTRQTFSNVGKNQFIEIKELATDYTKLDRKSFRLGGTKREAASVASPAGDGAKSNQ
jgi:tetratricopeptide (TPR) repeat protein